jgi:cyanophycinase-like exopeptidase
MKHLILTISLFFFLFSLKISAQTYVSYFTGDTTDVQTPTKGGICLMGGAGEDDNAMKWFLQQSGGGDILVIRCTGSSGYNSYLFSDLGIAVNSVETIVMPSDASALEPYVIQQIRNAEGLWIAGGDQFDYVSRWKDRPVEEAIKYLIHDKKVPIGGISAGMAIMGSAYFDAANGTVISATALASPFTNLVSLGKNDFLDHPLMQNVLTDTHYDNPDRRGRQMVFLARLVHSENMLFKGIACEEYASVCIDSSGLAKVFGTSVDNDNAYFLQTDCIETVQPEIIQPGLPLDWNKNQQAVKACKIKGTNNGVNTFDLRDWKTQTGGLWQNWWVENGVLKTSNNAMPPNCTNATETAVETSGIHISPNPSSDFLQIYIENFSEKMELNVIDLQGKNYLTQDILTNNTEISIKNMPYGVYFIEIKKGHAIFIQKLIKR